MDYLDILSSRSLLLFARPNKVTRSKSISDSLSSDDSPDSTPSSPNAQLPDPTPALIAMPIQSLIEGSSDSVYFLLTHVLATAFQPAPQAGSPGGDSFFGGGLGGTPKEVVGEAELLVWKEMDRAKMFGRELGQWFRGHGNSRISEGELERMASKWGLELEPLGGVTDAPMKGSQRSDIDLESFGSTHSIPCAVVRA
ncbi:hypothetical protein BD324DRAFT_650879 [Kockovaella imperatae]|uniref:Uncharacterized protein n=1 Tax=Kockovaella imperatae TaxID=4999 RepID=A0A1Y1UIF8_9TREE|nr:hypothetical protein BD324DRAFT_650879 [Kockovaella imperatae]ORX37274.1 hypothetical protein BD324DRAFT_650879 [Kockovaella imperatae]